MKLMMDAIPAEIRESTGAGSKRDSARAGTHKSPVKTTAKPKKSR